MCLFAIGIEHPLDITVQRLHDPNPSHHRVAAAAANTEAVWGWTTFVLEFMRTQVSRRRKEILQLQRAGISTASAELLLTRECWRRSKGFAPIGTDSRRKRAVQLRGACLAAGAGDGRAVELVRAPRGTRHG